MIYNSVLVVCKKVLVLPDHLFGANGPENKILAKIINHRLIEEL